MQRHTLRHAAPLLAALALGSCGPAGIVAGVGELNQKDVQERVVLVFVNQNEVPLLLDVEGATFRLQGLQVDPSGNARIEVPAGSDYRVLGQESTTSRAPVAWDYRVRADQGQLTSTLAQESMLFSSVLGTTSSMDPQDILDLQHYEPATKTFRSVSNTGLGFSPDEVCLAPGATRVFTLKDLGGNQVELRAFGLDSVSGSLAQIVPSIAGRTNPQSFGFVDAFECVLDPRGRFLWLLDHDDTTVTTRVRVFALDSDGTPVLTTTFTRGRIGDFELSTDGRNVYLAENFGAGFSIKALRLAGNGSFDFQINSAATPCTINDTNEPQIHLHPGGRSAYVAVPNSTPAVRLGSYQLLSDGSILSNGQCLGFESLFDLSFDPRGDVLYITGKNSSSTEGVLRYDIDPVNGQLTLVGTQTVSESLSRVTSQQDPQLSDSDPNKNLVFLVRDDAIVPHTRGAGAVLQSIPGASSLPYGNSSSARTVQSTRRGTATVTQN